MTNPRVVVANSAHRVWKRCLARQTSLMGLVTEEAVRSGDGRYEGGRGEVIRDPAALRQSALSQTSARKMYRPARRESQRTDAAAGAEGWMTSGEICLAGAPRSVHMWALPCLNSLGGARRESGRGSLLQRAARKLGCEKEEIPPV